MNKEIASKCHYCVIKLAVKEFQPAGVTSLDDLSADCTIKFLAHQMKPKTMSIPNGPNLSTKKWASFRQ